MEKKTYEISVICHNCKHVPEHNSGNAILPNRIAIPKGTEVKKFLADMTCENCGCSGFMGILS
jgi:hypothetical protein